MRNTRAGGGQVQDQSVEEILNAIGDQYARDVLALIGRKSRSAKEISGELEHSINTVYRRINLLKDNDLIEADMEVEADGNHHQVFKTTFDSVVISVGDEEYEVEIYRNGDLPGQFTGLWQDLSEA